jgi:uncharacterized protein (TIGR02466 family)
MQTIPLWPTLFYNFQWNQHDQHFEALQKVCYDLEQKQHISTTATTAKQGLYESAFDFVTQDNASVLEFSHWVKSCFFQAAAAANKPYWSPGMNVSIEIHESWCHITRNGGYHDMHAHPNSSWSAIYYLAPGDVDIETKNGVNRFYNPNNSMYMDAGTAWTTAATNVDFVPQAGMLVVFPSWINHSAMPYHGTKDRIVIALNCKINRADMTQVQITI